MPNRKRRAPNADLDDERQTKRPCLVPLKESTPLDVSSFAIVVGLASPLLYLEDFNTIKRAFPRPSLAQSLERFTTSILVRPCESIEGIPPLNYAKHTCKCPKEQYSASHALDIRSCHNLRTLVALRSHDHPIFEVGAFDLRPLRHLRRLYMHAPKSAKSANAKWWEFLPLELTDLCLVTDDTVPQRMRLNHLLHLQNLFLCSSIHQYTQEEKTKRGLAPYQFLPPNLTALKIVTKCPPHIGSDIVKTLPQSITWLELGSMSCYLDELPRSLVHLKSACRIALRTEKLPSGGNVTSMTDEEYETHAAVMVQEQSPPNWVSFVASQGALGAVHCPPVVKSGPHALIMPRTITDLHASGHRYEFDEVYVYDLPTKPLPTIKVFRSVLLDCGAASNLPNVESLAVYLGTADEMANLTALRHLTALHILLQPVDVRRERGVNFLPPCLKKLAVRGCSYSNILVGNVVIPLFLNEGLLQLDLYEVCNLRNNHSVTTFALGGGDKHLPKSLEVINFFACESYGHRAGTKERQEMLQYAHNRVSHFIANSDRPDVPFTCDIRREHYIRSHATAFSMENHASFFGVVDYNRMWGWKMYYDGA